MSAGVAERPLDGFDLAITGCVRSSSDGFGGALLAQAVAAELQAMGIVDDAVEDGIGEGRFADQVVPFVDRDLAGDQGGAAAIAVFDDFEHVVALLGPERPKAPIIEDQELERAQGARTELLLPGEKKLTKAQALSDAGLPARTVHHYEELAGPPKIRQAAAVTRNRI